MTAVEEVVNDNEGEIAIVVYERHFSRLLARNDVVPLKSASNAYVKMKTYFSIITMEILSHLKCTEKLKETPWSEIKFNMLELFFKLNEIQSISLAII